MRAYCGEAGVECGYPCGDGASAYRRGAILEADRASRCAAGDSSGQGDALTRHGWVRTSCERGAANNSASSVRHRSRGAGQVIGITAVNRRDAVGTCGGKASVENQ